MKKLTKLATIAMMASMATGASAMTTDGNWDDWFTYGGNGTQVSDDASAA